ncbi:hypothetical protein BJV82DRAFT_673542 [Fennellomyces sp. T-0311]|nr:hypothetical protein BJV82DRAFT_673542 [Fennellomyces sp. T-0311]
MDIFGPLIDLLTMMLDGEVLKGDHSHKIVKLIAQTGGSTPFTALYTVCNEYGEISLQPLTPTKALPHLKPSFEAMRRAYELYGHQPPKYFFTDNVRGDQRFLTNILPSLSVNMKPTSESALECLQWPDNVQVNVYSTATEINLACNLLLDRAEKKGCLLLVSIANGPLLLRATSSSSASFLRSDSVFKIGVRVDNDFRKIKDFGVECRGSVELGTFCKDRGRITNAAMSLADITATVLEFQLAKESDQVAYAALDAWVSLAIHEKLKHIRPAGLTIRGPLEPGTPISLRDPVAKPTGTQRIAIRVTNVTIPGYILDLQEKSLSDFSPTPFTAVAKKSQLRTANTIDLETPLPSSTHTSSATFSSASAGNDGNNTDEPTEDVLQTRVLKDAFHLMDQIKVSKRHGLHAEFFRWYRDALFVYDEDDRKRVEEFLESNSTSWKQMLAKNPSWIFKRVKRVIPPPEKLYPIIEDLFNACGPLKCAKSQLPLFDAAAEKQAKNVLKAIKDGHVSDPPGASFYFKIGRDKNSLPLYRCSRGTNSIEGGVHQNLIRRLGSFGASPHLIQNVLTDYRLGHNTDVSSF